jgi:DNA-binding LytR/AlgR family response regulator
VQSYIFIRHDGKFKQIEFQDVLYIEAKKNYTRIALKEKPAILILTTLKQWDEALPPDMFCRIHRSYIVSIDKIKSFDNHYVYLSTEKLPIGDQYRIELLGKVTIVSPELVNQSKFTGRITPNSPNKRKEQRVY